MLQGKSGDLIKAAQEVIVVINILKAVKGDPSFWKEVYERGNRMQLSLTLCHAYQEQPEGSNTG